MCECVCVCVSGCGCGCEYVCMSLHVCIHVCVSNMCVHPFVSLLHMVYFKEGK